jgi:hypothetical protein
MRASGGNAGHSAPVELQPARRVGLTAAMGRSQVSPDASIRQKEVGLHEPRFYIKKAIRAHCVHKQLSFFDE